jgi:hypothetical protein
MDVFIPFSRIGLHQAVFRNQPVSTSTRHTVSSVCRALYDAVRNSTSSRPCAPEPNIAEQQTPMRLAPTYDFLRRILSNAIREGNLRFSEAQSNLSYLQKFVRTLSTKSASYIFGRVVPSRAARSGVSNADDSETLFKRRCLWPTEL